VFQNRELRPAVAQSGAMVKKRKKGDDEAEAAIGPDIAHQIGHFSCEPSAEQVLMCKIQ